MWRARPDVRPLRTVNQGDAGGVRETPAANQSQSGGSIPPPRSKLRLTPITQAEGKAFIAKQHRHHKPKLGAVFVLACELDGTIRGVAMVGYPVARMLQDGYTLEVNRLATDGTRNACSFLYGAAWKAARALGYRRLVTYTLPQEGGSSLRAAGWKLIGEAGGGSWHRKERPRVDSHPTQTKLRWEALT